MSQDYVDNVFVSTEQVQANMAQIEDNFAALKSMFSGASAPSDIVAGMCWFDTTVLKAPKIRNKASDAWLGIMQADASHKLWVYRNTAPDGWTVDATVTDAVCALKGGAGLYNANGGTTAGSWTQPDCTLDATMIPAHTHGNSGSHLHSVALYYPDGATYMVGYTTGGIPGLGSQNTGSTAHEHTSVGGGLAHNHGTAYRPAAAIGTMQYLSI